jgi:CheY-like chemotaxis protein
MNTPGHPTALRVLVVEDQFTIAAELVRLLRALGAVVVGPVGDVERALALAEVEQLDAAFLDVNLNGARVFPAADALARRGVPYAFISGYDVTALPEIYRGMPRLEKPVDPRALAEVLAELIRGSAGPGYGPDPGG